MFSPTVAFLLASYSLTGPVSGILARRLAGPTVVPAGCGVGLDCFCSWPCTGRSCSAWRPVSPVTTGADSGGGLEAGTGTATPKSAVTSSLSSGQNVDETRSTDTTLATSATAASTTAMVLSFVSVGFCTNLGSVAASFRSKSAATFDALKVSASMDRSMALIESFLTYSFCQRE